VEQFLNFVSTVAPYGVGGSLVWATVYLLTHPNDPRSLLGHWLYNRDLDRYFNRGVETEMQPEDAWKWAQSLIDSKWDREIEPGPPPPELPPSPNARDPGDG
jgi:hypothetical protein